MWDKKYYEVIDSTNEEAKKLIIENKVSDLCLIYAGHQTAGRGRFSRKWVSPLGNVYASFVMKEYSLNVLGYIVSLSIMESLIELGLSAEKVNLKWPNDVLIEGKKVSGILLEVCEDYIIIGIGINIVSHPDLVDYKTTDLCFEGLNTDRDAVIEKLGIKLLENISEYKTKGFGEIKKKWLNRAYKLGEEITVSNVNNKISGIFKGINEDGGLLLTAGKKEIRIYAGDVFL